jgi:hypothetical protein
LLVAQAYADPTKSYPSDQAITCIAGNIEDNPDYQVDRINPQLRLLFLYQDKSLPLSHVRNQTRTHFADVRFLQITPAFGLRISRSMIIV